jgi:hypothetical protein
MRSVPATRSSCCCAKVPGQRAQSRQVRARGLRHLLRHREPVDVLVAVTERGRGVAGVVDGSPPVGVETDSDVADRRSLLRSIGYKL